MGEPVTWAELEEMREAFGMTPQQMAGIVICTSYNTYRNWKTRDKVPAYAANAVRKYARFEAARPGRVSVTEFEQNLRGEQFVLVRRAGQWVPARAYRKGAHVRYRVMRLGTKGLLSEHITGVVVGA